MHIRIPYLYPTILFGKCLLSTIIRVTLGNTLCIPVYTRFVSYITNCSYVERGGLQNRELRTLNSRLIVVRKHFCRN